MPLSRLEPQAVWQWFADICSIPHPTYGEQALADFIVGRAQTAGLAVRRDGKGNIYLSKPAVGAGMADKEGVILQAHIDMVAQKTPESAHDFARDPIRTVVEDGWVRAEQTTLGADNGIGAAMALAVAFSDSVEHPPLEVLLTVEEEIGMGGVRAVEAGYLKGTRLLNLDTEESGSIYLGCAGGRDAEFRLPLPRSAAEGKRWRLTLSGLTGGHSGMDIHRGRGNAIVLLADVLHRLSAQTALRLAAFSGGRLRNVIPREAAAEIVLPDTAEALLREVVAAAEAEMRAVFGAHAAALKLVAEAAGSGGTACSAADSRRALNLLCALPDGVLRHSDDFPGVSETSICLSVAELGGEDLHVCLLMRSLLESPKDVLSRRLAALAEMCGADLLFGDDYPAWTPDASSSLFRTTRTVFAEFCGREPKVEVIHAGLECGLMRERLPNVEMVSFGPTIEGAHTPRERVNIAAVAECWEILLLLLRRL